MLFLRNIFHRYQNYFDSFSALALWLDHFMLAYKFTSPMFTDGL